MKYLYLLSIPLTVSCADVPNSINNNVTTITPVNTNGDNIASRFAPPAGFKRVEVEQGSFAEYLRNLPLKPAGSAVLFYDGSTKNKNVHAAVVDIDVGTKDLQQCADAVMRLRAEYLYQQKRYDKISFLLTNGFSMDYKHWMNGNRLVIEGNNSYWKQLVEPSNSYISFRKYLDIVFSYAGTLSMTKQLRPQQLSSISIGDVFIKGGSPGHAVIVVDMAINNSGNKLFMIAQSYMPAQNIHVLKNLEEEELSPWYKANFTGFLQTPEWTFYPSQLKTW